MSWFSKKKETDQSSETAPNWSLVEQDPRKNVRTTSAATSTTNTAVQNSTIFDHNNHTVTYMSTRQTVTHTQQAKVTEIVHRRTPSQAELEELFASMRMGKGATTTTTTTTSTGNSRSRPPSLNGVALRSTTNFKANATNSSGGAKRTSTIAKTEHTTVTQKNGKTVTQRVETQRVEVKPKSKWPPWSTQSSASSSSSSSATAPSSSTALKPYVSPYAHEKPSAFGYVSTYGQQKPLTTSFTPSTSFKPTTSSKILTSTSVPKPYSSYTAPTTAPSPLSHFDAKGSLPQKPSTSSSTSSLSKIFAKKKLKPARVYIFNHEKFDTENEYRVGSAQDVKALRKVFEQFKCKVEVITNGTVATVRSTIRMLESKRFEEQSALVIVILTHGRRHDKLAAKDSDYSLDDDVIFPILRNRTLSDKPKLFFVQACKGSMEKGGFKTDAAQPHGAPNEIYKCYSTYEGYVSFRTEDGTPFIQTLCEALERSGKTKDIDSIMTDVRVVVKQATQDGQIPSVTSTLTSKYVFGDYL